MTTESQKAFEEWWAYEIAKLDYDDEIKRCAWWACQASEARIRAMLESEEMVKRVSNALFEYGNQQYCTRKAKAALKAIVERIT